MQAWARSPTEPRETTTPPGAGEAHQSKKPGGKEGSFSSLTVMATQASKTREGADSPHSACPVERGAGQTGGGSDGRLQAWELFCFFKFIGWGDLG